MLEVEAVHRPRLSPKAQILARSLLDVVIDLLLPTLIFLILAPTGLSAVVRLSIGGFFVAAKACGGSVVNGGREHTPGALGHAALIACGCTAATVATLRMGGSEGLAVGLGAVLLVVAQGLALTRRRVRPDGFALLVLVELLATIALTGLSGDPRIVLIRPSFYTAIAGAYVLATVWSAQPFMMQATRPMAAGGDPVRAAAFDRAGRGSSRFRRLERTMTAGLALVLFGEAALRVGTVLYLPQQDLNASSLLSQAPSILLFVVFLAVLRVVFVPRVRAEVDAFMPCVEPGVAKAIRATEHL